MKEEKDEISEKHLNFFMLYKWRRKEKNSRRCANCNIDVHRASFVKHLISKKLLENEKKSLQTLSKKYNQHDKTKFITLNF